MRRLWRKLVCRVIGHDTDPVDVYCCVCFRCGLEWNDYQDPPRNDLWFWLAWYDFRVGQWYRWRVVPWFKCPFCNCRFGRHHPTDCVPF